jgi:hypothetical protein
MSIGGLFTHVICVPDDDEEASGSASRHTEGRDTPRYGRLMYCLSRPRKYVVIMGSLDVYAHSRTFFLRRPKRQRSERRDLAAPSPPSTKALNAVISAVAVGQFVDGHPPKRAAARAFGVQIDSAWTGASFTSGAVQC